MVPTKCQSLDSLYFLITHVVCKKKKVLFVHFFKSTLLNIKHKHKKNCRTNNFDILCFIVPAR